MKKVLAAVGIASLMASSAFALSFSMPGATNNAGDGVVKSKHNMNLYAETAKDAEGRVCAFCHTPHHALKDDTAGGWADYLPLWSHQLTTRATFNPYQSPTVGVDTSASLQGPSILCMSCHDGAIAVDQHYGSANGATRLNDDNFGGTAVGLDNGPMGVGDTNLTNDHPIGFLYADIAGLRPKDLNPDTTVFTGSKNNKTIASQLTNGFMTCATCHDVHNKDNVKSSYPGATGNYFLMGDQNGSAFCLTCHNK